MSAPIITLTARKAAIKSFLVDFGGRARGAYPLAHTRTEVLALLDLAELVQAYMNEPGESSCLHYVGALARLQEDGELRVHKAGAVMVVSLSLEAFTEAKRVQQLRDARK